MGLLRSSELRAVIDNSGLSDISESIRSLSDADASIVWDSNLTSLYLGFKHQFNSRYFAIPNGSVTPSAMSVSFWNGSTWVAFQDVVDETEGFSRSGFVIWENLPRAGSWHAAANDSIPEIGAHSAGDFTYWIKIKLSGSQTIAITAIKFLLSDDRMISDLFPEIMQYLPSGKTDFLPQHDMAANAIVNILKAKKLISYREQLKNPDDWFMAATYKAIQIILDPIAGDERLNLIKKSIAAEVSRNLEISFASIDVDKSETLNEDENPDSKSKTAGASSGWSYR